MLGKREVADGWAEAFTLVQVGGGGKSCIAEVMLTSLLGGVEERTILQE